MINIVERTRHNPEVRRSLRNLIDLKRPPGEAFLHLTQDRGVQFLEQPDFFCPPMAPAEIHGFAASEYPEINERIEGFLNFNARFRRFSQVMEVNSVPILVSNADFRKSYVTVGEKCILSGASGNSIAEPLLLGERGQRAQSRSGADRVFQSTTGGKPVGATGRENRASAGNGLCDRVPQYLQLLPLCH